jgi:hypothetical protein
MKQEQLTKAIEALQSIDLNDIKSQNTVKYRIKKEIEKQVEDFNKFFKTHEIIEYGVTFEDFTVLKTVDQRLSIDQYIFEQGIRYLTTDYGLPDIYETELVVDGANQIAKEFRATVRAIKRLNELLYGSKGE